MSCNRRSALIGTLAAGSATRATHAGDAVLDLSTDSSGASRLDGTIATDLATRAAAAQDFGHLVHHTPAAVVQAASARDVATVLRWAVAHRRPVAARGRGHSVYGRSQARDGIVIDMTRMNAVHHIQDDRVVVEAGASWEKVLSATLPHGLAPPALPDYLGLSVGGTLVVGGVGGGISRHGVVADNVLELEVVTGRGELLRCSPTQHRELFDAVPAGLGQVAVIARAALALVALPRQVRRCVLTYADLRSLLHDQSLLLAEGRFDQVQGAALAAPTGGWTFRLDAVKAFDGNAPDDGPLLAGLSDRRGQAAIETMSALEHARRLAVLEQALRANRQWWHPHPWLTTFVGDSRVGDVVGVELATLEPTALGPFGQIGLSAFTRHAVRCPLLRLPADAVCWAFNLIRVPAQDNLDDAARLVADNRRIYERLRASGGTLYPASAFAMSRDDWRAHFGQAFHALAAAKQKFDPGAVLTPGYELF